MTVSRAQEQTQGTPPKTEGPQKAYFRSPPPLVRLHRQTLRHGTRYESRREAAKPDQMTRQLPLRCEHRRLKMMYRVRVSR
jgi:hypothetical protein